MRSKERIRPFLEELLKLWKVGTSEKSLLEFIQAIKLQKQTDFYYSEDYDFLQELEGYLGIAEVANVQLSNEDNEFINSFANVWENELCDLRFMQIFDNTFDWQTGNISLESFLEAIKIAHYIS